MGLQRALFGTEFVASTFYSARRPKEVLAELRHLSGGATDIEAADCGPHQ
jgi:hypothetical protein